MTTPSNPTDVDGVTFEERFGPVTLARRRLRERRAGSDKTSRESAPGELGYQPSLDGLRAVAVIAVLFFHARFLFASGGFLGVSAFFTLSGFLITTLLIAERRREGSISLRSFWVRRFRRLLPAAWVCLAAVLAMGALGIWDAAQMRDLRGDAPAALAQVINWHFIFADRSYGDAFAAPSPLEHYWSLAVEEQFYLLFPLLAVALLAVAKGRKWMLGAAAMAGVLTSVMLTTRFVADGVDRVYFGTDTRLAELAVGVLLAVVVSGRSLTLGRVASRLAAIAGIAGLLFHGAMFGGVTLGTAWLYPWGLLATSLATAAVILGALQPGPLRSLLSNRVLVYIGTISYGIYLLHWPIFLWLTPARTGFGQWPLFGVRIGATLLAAIASYTFVEQPMRTGSWPVGPARWTLAPLAVVTLLGATAMTTDSIEVESALVRGQATQTGQVIEAAPAPQRILVIGDQLAASTVAGFAPHVEAGDVEVRFMVAPDCGMAVSGFVKLPDGTLEKDQERCGSLPEERIRAEAEMRPDVVLVWSAVRDAGDRWLGPETNWSHVGKPSIADFTQGEYNASARALAEGGAHVVWMTSPHLMNSAEVEPLSPALPPEGSEDDLVRRGGQRDIPPAGHFENDAARIDALNRIIERLSDVGVRRLDAAAQLAAWPGGEFDPVRRPDGVGLSPDASEDIVSWALGSVGSLERRNTATIPEQPSAPIVTVPPAPELSARRTTEPGESTRVLVVGDSVGYNLGYGARLVSEGRSDVVAVNAGQFGCPMARGGNYRYLTEVSTFLDRCDWSKMYIDFLGSDPDVVVLVSGIWDVVDRILPGDFEWRSVGDPLYDSYLLSEVVSSIDLLASRGATVVVSTYPHLEAGRDQGYQDLPESDPARVDRLNEILVEAVSLRPGVATMVDLRGWLASLPGGQLDPAIRSDGLHFVDSFAPTLGEWLIPQAVAVATQGIG